MRLTHVDPVDHEADALESGTREADALESGTREADALRG